MVTKLLIASLMLVLCACVPSTRGFTETKVYYKYAAFTREDSLMVAWEKSIFALRDKRDTDTLTAEEQAILESSSYPYFMMQMPTMFKLKEYIPRDSITFYMPHTRDTVQVFIDNKLVFNGLTKDKRCYDCGEDYYNKFTYINNKKKKTLRFEVRWYVGKTYYKGIIHTGYPKVYFSSRGGLGHFYTLRYYDFQLREYIE